MAYVLNNGQNQDDDEQQGQGVGQPVQLAGQNSVMSGTGSASSNPSAAANVPKRAASSGTGFTNISQYLDQNASQAQGLANQVGDYVKGQGDVAKSALDQVETNFNTRVDLNTVKYNQEQAQQAAQNAAAFAQDDKNVEAFKKMRDAQYQGPLTLQDDTENYMAATNAVNKAKQVAQDVQSEQGRKDILGQIQAGRNTTAGVNTFNNLLLAGDEARNTIQQSADGLGELETRLSSTAESAAAKAAAAKAETEATRNSIISQFGGDGTNSVDTLYKSLQDKTNKFITNTDSLNQSALNNFKNGKALSAEQLRVLGITNAQYNELLAQNNYLKSAYGQNQYGNLALPSYLQAKTAGAEYNIDNVTTADEYARLQALSKLMDADTAGYISDPSKLGTAKDDLIDLNYGALSSNVKSTLNSQTAAKQAAREQQITNAYTAYLREMQEIPSNTFPKAIQGLQKKAMKNLQSRLGSAGAGQINHNAIWNAINNSYAPYEHQKESKQASIISKIIKNQGINQQAIDFNEINALLDKYNKGQY
jgi:hypothetical protein